MNRHNNRSDRITAHLAFSGLLLAIHGWLIIATVLIKTGAGMRPHFVIAMPACALAALALRRWRVWWTALQQSDGGTAGMADRSQAMGGICSILGLAIVGGMLGWLGQAESVIGGGISALILILTPWSRFSLCHTHPLLSCAVFAAGTAPGLLLTVHPADVLAGLISTWTLWIIGLSAVMATYRKPSAAALALAEKQKAQP